MNIQIYTCLFDSSSYYKSGRKEYEKRLSRYCKIKHTICKNEKQKEKVRLLLSQLPEEQRKNGLIWVTAGKSKSHLDSPGLASLIEQKGIQGISSLCFLVGFPEDFFSDFDNSLPLSISRMDIPPDLLSLILEEQIYRAYRIIRKEPYHK